LVNTLRNTSHFSQGKRISHFHKFQIISFEPDDASSQPPSASLQLTFFSGPGPNIVLMRYNEESDISPKKQQQNNTKIEMKLTM